ncbi:hypothetical protein JZ751_028740 [Albula glossodonta]|uniref:CUB domain-containing protein n=1 Tax=Albula glossodonta TaxID=121402 RepID=A0A8T2NII9_9TELE|nr:hypothetical protein JZ751_028740 [Albula glossodonta]
MVINLHRPRTSVRVCVDRSQLYNIQGECGGGGKVEMGGGMELVKQQRKRENSHANGARAHIAYAQLWHIKVRGEGGKRCARIVDRPTPSAAHPNPPPPPPPHTPASPARRLQFPRPRPSLAAGDHQRQIDNAEETGGDSGAYDYVEVRDGVDENGQLVGKYCGKIAPSPVVSSGNQLYIKFVSDYETHGAGFSIRYEIFKTGMNLAHAEQGGLM